MAKLGARLILTRIEKIALVVGAIFSAILFWGACSGKVDLKPTEVLGFVTGAAGVYLTVKSHIWNFPIGLANNLFFGVLFFENRLYNDMSLQVIFFVLGVWGWWQWARGQENEQQLPIGRAKVADWVGCSLFLVLGTAFMTVGASHWGGAAPFWDALTTALSLAAQYLLGRKYLENWAFWLLADIIYVPLYISRGLYLTGALYFGFGCLCVLGFSTWRRQWEQHELENRRSDRQILAASSGP